MTVPHASAGFGTYVRRLVAALMVFRLDPGKSCDIHLRAHAVTCHAQTQPMGAGFVEAWGSPTKSQSPPRHLPKVRRQTPWA